MLPYWVSVKCLKSTVRGVKMNSVYKRQLRRAKLRDRFDMFLVNVIGYSVLAMGGIICASAWYWFIVLIFQLEV